MSVSLVMETAFRGPLAPGYSPLAPPPQIDGRLIQ